MRRYVFSTFLFPLLVLVLTGCTGPVKEPAVAGSFYPGEKEALEKMVDGFLSRAENAPVEGRLVALIAPHAGYQYSGAIAAHTYRQIGKRNIRTVILIGPSHYKSFRGASVFERGSMKTPLGLVKIDRKLARSLINEDAGVTFYPDAFEREHSLEVQLPFLQRTLKDVQIVPILIGAPTKESFDFLTGKLTEIMREDEEVLLIASTDFSHYHDYATAVAKDRKTINAIERLSIEEVQKYLMSGEGEMCGGYPVLYTMAVARGLGATNGVVYRYANSGDVTGEKSRVVGYAAMGLYKSPLSESQKKRLLEIARETIMGYVQDGMLPDGKKEEKRLLANGATFVTIKTDHGMLRGCMGNIIPSMPLSRSVIVNAVSACSRDPRFPPMNEGELKGIDVEVTVLSPLEPLKDKGSIEIGKHGLYIVQENRSGILLPQVPVERGWDRNTFLEQVSLKAGLPRDSWKTAQLFRFTADIIR